MTTPARRHTDADHATCVRCNEQRPTASYPRDGKGRRSLACHVCRNARRRERGESAKRRVMETADERRARLLREKYGLSQEQYEAIAAEQQGCCAICGQAPESGKWLAIDHCHQTGRVRALLCTYCNLAVGVYESRGAAIANFLAKYGGGHPLLKQ